MRVRRAWPGPFAALRVTTGYGPFAALRVITGLRLFVALWVPTIGLVVAGCASVSRPPGGPEDHAPPEVIAISIDTNATMVTAGKLDIQFDEIVAERPTGGASTLQGASTLETVVLVSPRTGPTKVSWHRDRITIEPRGGFKANTTYRITLLPGIADIRGNVRKQPLSFVFSTGASAPPFSVLGRVFDWQASTPAPSATVEAIANAGTKDSLSYIAFTDSTGQFDVGPLDPGKYLVRGFIDGDNSRTIGPLEKWDTVTVTVTDHRPVVELLAIQRDTAPPGIQRVEVLDSMWIRLTLDKPYDPRMILQPAFVILKRADSTEMQVAAVMSESQAASLRQKPDTTTPARPLPPRPAALDSISTQAPAVRPSINPPEQVIVVHLAQGAALQVDGKYAITIRGIRNLVGHSGSASYEFVVLKPKPPAAP